MQQAAAATIPTLCVNCNLFVEVPASQKNAVCPYCSSPYDVRRGEELYYKDSLMREESAQYVDAVQRARTGHYAEPETYTRQNTYANPAPSAAQMDLTAMYARTKFCKYCGEKIDSACVVCTHCGKQVEALKVETVPVQPVYMNYAPAYAPMPVGKPKNKGVALLLWFFTGIFGGHKFYEGKTGTGLLYLFTAGLFGIGWFFDLFGLLLKPNTYYVDN